MRCHDSGGDSANEGDEQDGRGEPPAVLVRRTTADVLALVERELSDVEVVRLFDAEWLEQMAGGATFEAMLEAFRSRGGRVERHAGPRTAGDS